MLTIRNTMRNNKQINYFNTIIYYNIISLSITATVNDNNNNLNVT